MEKAVIIWTLRLSLPSLVKWYGDNGKGKQIGWSVIAEMRQVTADKGRRHG